MLDSLSAISMLVIVGFCLFHIVLFITLTISASRDWKNLALILDDFTRGLTHRSALDSTEQLADQVDAFLADVKEVLNDQSREEDRKLLATRIQILDEKREYLNSISFARTYNIARTMIEAYPLAGVLGTILAIGAALQGDAQTGQEGTVQMIVKQFGDAIWSTFAGLTSAIVLMFINSGLEPGFERLEESRKMVHDTVARVKRELALKADISNQPTSQGETS